MCKPRHLLGAFLSVWLLSVPLFLSFPSTSLAAGLPGQGDSTIFVIPVRPGWNLLSLPVRPFHSLKDSVFPSSVSDAIRFRYGYIPAHLLENGYGFWMKFASAETIAVAGHASFIDTLTLQKGWNLIGLLTTPVAVNRIRTDPGGIIVSHYFRYVPDSGYVHADTLRPGFGYWVKTNRAGSMFVKSLDVPCPGIPAMEYGGKIYTTVQIVDQCWMRENLDVGEWIYAFEDPSDNEIIEKYCFNDDPNACRWYGAMYQWEEAIQYSTSGGRKQGICPPGWHIPTLGEFMALAAAVDDDGNALKREWQGRADGVGTNESGFTAILTGYRQRDGYFGMAGYNAYLWSSTEFDGEVAHSMYLFGTIDLIWLNANFKDYGFSVRCVKD